MVSVKVYLPVDEVVVSTSATLDAEKFSYF